MISRRRFFVGSGAASAVSLGFPQVARSADALQALPGNKPRHIIHLVADGLSLGTLTAANYFSHLVRERPLTWFALWERPAVRRALMNMRSLNSIVTDSSAASSSWGSGSRIVNGALNRLPDGRDLVPLYTLFADAGWRRGLVTTTEITHATPAGFAASTTSRDSAAQIASQYLDRKVEVLLGGGQKFFDPRKRKDKRDLKAEFAQAGYAVMQTAAELDGAPADKPWLGIFDRSHLPFTIDHLASEKLRTVVPTLPAMTRAALGWLGRRDHFILQVEGGRVDHAAHNCDAAAALHDMLAFDEALDVCLEFQQRAPDTLLVVTTDHGTGNPGVNGTGTAYGQSPALLKNLTRVKASFAEILRRCYGLAEDLPDEDDEDAATTINPDAVASGQGIAAILAETTGYKVPARLATLFRPFLLNKGTCLYGAMNSATAQLGQLLGNHLGIGWAGGSHTADFVPLLALGPGAERFAGFLQNTEVFRHYTGLAGIDYRNPELPLLAEAGPAAAERVEDYARV